LLIVFYIEFFDYIDVTDLQPFHLSSSDMECLEPGRWLHDNIITATQRLLQIQYPEINGLQSPVLGQKLAFAVHSNGAKFIQIFKCKEKPLDNGNKHYHAYITFKINFVVTWHHALNKMK
jgi:hypothetical protein